MAIDWKALTAAIGLGPKTPPTGPAPDGSLTTAAGMVVQGANALFPTSAPAPAVVQSGTDWTPWIIGGGVVVVALLLLRGGKK